MSKHEKFWPLCNYLGGGVVIIGLVLVLAPYPKNEILAAIVSALIAVSVIWAYWPEGKHKNARRTKIAHSLRGDKAVLLFSLFLEGLSVYGLYLSAYLLGVHDLLPMINELASVICSIIPCPNTIKPLTLALPQLYLGIAMGIAGIGIGTTSFATTMYFRGLARGARSHSREVA